MSKGRLIKIYRSTPANRIEKAKLKTMGIWPPVVAKRQVGECSQCGAYTTGPANSCPGCGTRLTRPESTPFLRRVMNWLF